jgi:putative transposase
MNNNKQCCKELHNKFFCKDHKNDKKIEHEEPLHKSVALDPGVRTFQTFYSPDGVAGKLGDNFVNTHLIKTAKRIDYLDTVKSKTTNKKTHNNIRRRQALLRTKIKNCVNDLHWKTIDFLVKNFQTIILPNFEVKQMTQLTANSRKINSKTVRNMLSLSHYSFKCKMEYKCRSLNRNLLIVNESYTSQTCGKCGNLNKQLGGQKIFNCLNCKVKIDRDLNGARNIMLKTCTRDCDTSSLKDDPILKMASNQLNTQKSNHKKAIKSA